MMLKMLEQYLTAENFKTASIFSMATLHVVGDLRLIYSTMKASKDYKRRRAELVEKAKNGDINELELEKVWGNTNNELANSIKTTFWKKYMPLQIAALASFIPFSTYAIYNHFFS